MEESLRESSHDKFLLDTSAFLSLESVYLLDRVINLYSVNTTLSVLRELENFARYDDQLGIIAKRILVKKNKLLLRGAGMIEKLHHVSSTDAELFTMALKEGIVLITDDIKLLRHTAGKIKRAFSTYFLTDFVHADIMTKQEALATLELLRTMRNWQENIISIYQLGNN